MQDHYETLGVARDATQDEIRAAYRRAAKDAHPDREGGSTEHMQAVNAAYDVLGDEARRKAYDEGGEADGPRGVAMAILHSIFRDAIHENAPDPMRYAESKLNTSERGAIERVSNTRRVIRCLESQRQRIKAKGHRDLYHEILEAAIRAAQDEVQTLERNLENVQNARTLLATEYERGHTCPEPEAMKRRDESWPSLHADRLDAERMTLDDRFGFPSFR